MSNVVSEELVIDYYNAENVIKALAEKLQMGIEKSDKKEAFYLVRHDGMKFLVSPIVVTSENDKPQIDIIFYETVVNENVKDSYVAYIPVNTDDEIMYLSAMIYNLQVDQYKDFKYEFKRKYAYIYNTRIIESFESYGKMNPINIRYLRGTADKSAFNSNVHLEIYSENTDRTASFDFNGEDIIITFNDERMTPFTISAQELSNWTIGTAHMWVENKDIHFELKNILFTIDEFISVLDSYNTDTTKFNSKVFMTEIEFNEDYPLLTESMIMVTNKGKVLFLDFTLYRISQCDYDVDVLNIRITDIFNKTLKRFEDVKTLENVLSQIKNDIY